MVEGARLLGQLSFDELFFLQGLTLSMLGNYEHLSLART